MGTVSPKNGRATPVIDLFAGGRRLSYPIGLMRTVRECSLLLSATFKIHDRAGWLSRGRVFVSLWLNRELAKPRSPMRARRTFASNAGQAGSGGAI
jgi:hypothetical protein